MKRLTYITFTIVLIVFSLFLISCKDDPSPIEPQDSLLFLEDQHKIRDEFIKNIQKTTLDSSIMQTITWAENQTYVSTASRLLNGVRVEYTSGFNGAVVYLNSDTKGSSQVSIKRKVNQIQEIGKDQIDRQTNIKNVLSKNIFNIQKENIGNKKVLIWAPFEKDFTIDMRTTLAPVINDANVKLDLNILTDNSCTISSFEKITDYGLIIIDSHGSEGKFILTNENIVV